RPRRSAGDNSIVRCCECTRFLLEARRMSKVLLGLIAGIVFGAVDVGLMLPMSFPDKKTALLGAFTSRFAIGFVIGCVQLPSWPGWVVGLVFGLLISLPDAIITHKYLPILVLGGIGGLVIGGLIHGWKAHILR